MKRFPLVAAAVVLTVVLMSCPQPFTPSRSGDEGPTSFQLPADGITDTPRASGGAFTFETLFPVELALDVTLYGRDADGHLVDEPLDPALHTVNVSLTNSRGNTVYSGRLRSDGSLAAIVYLASAPEDMTLTLSSAGFDSRTVAIARMVEFSRIERAMAIAQAPPGSRAASTIEFGDPDYQLNIPAEGVLTIAFEDLFGRANAGDADYNDFIAEYRITETIDGETGGIVSIAVDAEAKVKLAGYTHAFGIRIDSFAGDATVTGEYIDESGAVARLEDLPEFATPVSAPAEIVLFEHSGRAVGKAAWFELEFAVGQYRTEESEKKQLPSKQPELSAPPYNPYILVHNTGHDIHLIGREALTVSKNPGDPFIDSDGFPWALLVPRDWEHPEEAQRIEVKYPRFTNWRESGGEEHQDWYDWLYEPYVPEPETGARLAANINATGGSSPANLTVYGGALYFSANDGVSGNELWRYDGTSAERVTDLVSGGGNSNPGFLTVYDGELYFAASYDGGERRGLFRYDGADAPVLVESLTGAGNLAVYDGALYSRGYDETHGTELWVFNGTTASLAADINEGSGSSNPSFLTAHDDGLYMQANDGDSGIELWRYAGGTAELVADLNPGGLGLPSRFITYNGDLYFRANDGTNGFELWRYDGVSVERRTNINEAGSGVQNAEMIVYDGTLYFAGTDGSDGWELYRYAGGAVERVADLNPGAGDGLSNPAQFVVYEGYLYFAGNDGESGDELYRYDGESVELAAEINPLGSSNPESFAIWDGRLYFKADDGVDGAELWVYR